MAQTELILASASPARATTLRAAGITPLVAPTDADEAGVLQDLREEFAARGQNPEPADQVGALARIKAQQWAREGRKFGSNDRQIVIGCDSMLEFRGEMLGKPHHPDVAAARIRELQGQDAVLWTGHHLQVWEGGALVSEVTGTESTIVHFDEMSEDEISAYVQTGEPLEVAGSFTIDGLGGPFIRGVTGDPHSVVGISLPLVRRLARDLGVFWPDLWDRPRENA